MLTQIYIGLRKRFTEYCKEFIDIGIKIIMFTLLFLIMISRLYNFLQVKLK